MEIDITEQQQSSDNKNYVPSFLKSYNTKTKRLQTHDLKERNKIKRCEKVLAAYTKQRR